MMDPQLLLPLFLSLPMQHHPQIPVSTPSPVMQTTPTYIRILPPQGNEPPLPTSNYKPTIKYMEPVNVPYTPTLTTELSSHDYPR